MDPTKKSIESSTAKSMFPVVERMNAGYEKYFDSKPKMSGVRSECYSSFVPCDNMSKNSPKLSAEVKTEEGNSEKQDVVQQFFPQRDEAELEEEVKQQEQVIVGSGCCKYIVKKEK